jgi:Zn-dependent protease with chaperone function
VTAATRYTSQASGVDVVHVERWSSERPLRWLVALAALLLWIVIAVSIVGAAYAAFLAVFFFVIHLAFITHLRGNGVKLGPEQMPELHSRVLELSGRLGLDPAPDAYVMQAGGALNALATRFLSRNFIVLYSELLDACGDNTEARDMIVAHELGHLRAGHLRWRWLLLPGIAMPFLGQLYSRACEYTSDRYGMAVCRDREAGLRGLAILAAGGRSGARVSLEALARQREDMNSMWMKIGEWLGTHPPIARRLAVLEPRLAPVHASETRARIGALLLLAVVMGVPLAGAGVLVKNRLLPAIQNAIAQAQARQAGSASATIPGASAAPVDAAQQVATARDQILSLARAVEGYRASSGALPADTAALYQVWRAEHPGEPDPLDPWSGTEYGYGIEGEHFAIWTLGADPNLDSDNLVYSTRAAPAQ